MDYADNKLAVTTDQQISVACPESTGLKPPFSILALRSLRRLFDNESTNQFFSIQFTGHSFTWLPHCCRCFKTRFLVSSFKSCLLPSSQTNFTR
eukprot:scaffold23337_cov45-Cyclotella_meneghiniana.AAC.2